MQLILDGVLDDSTEAALAARLSVSARHLRRLFTDHLGVTPDALARSARAHFARRLLDDTDLSVAEITFAAGFGSVRQFNRSCLAVFRMTPNQLRARRRRADRLVADGGLVLRLPFLGPLDWDATLALLADRATPGVEHVADGTYRRTIIVDGHPGVLELTSGGADHLLLRLHLPRWQGLVHIVGRARRLASLGLDLDRAIEHLAQDAVVGPLVAQRPGLRPPGTWDPFETGVRAILDQHASAQAGDRHAAQLVERYGEPVPGLTQLGLTHTFPSPLALTSAPLEELDLSPIQAVAIRRFSRAVATGKLRLDRSVSLDRLLTELTALAGLDEETAHYIAFRVGETDAYPSLPTAAQLAAGTRCPMDVKGAAGWSPWRAIAATHVWFQPAAALPRSRRGRC